MHITAYQSASVAYRGGTTEDVMEMGEEDEEWVVSESFLFLRDKMRRRAEEEGKIPVSVYHLLALGNSERETATLEFNELLSLFGRSGFPTVRCHLLGFPVNAPKPGVKLFFPVEFADAAYCFMWVIFGASTMGAVWDELVLGNLVPGGSLFLRVRAEDLTIRALNHIYHLQALFDDCQVLKLEMQDQIGGERYFCFLRYRPPPIVPEPPAHKSPPLAFIEKVEIALVPFGQQELNLWKRVVDTKKPSGAEEEEEAFFNTRRALRKSRWDRIILRGRS